MTSKEKTKASKFLSLILRHKPETIDITLDKNGWADVSTLIKKMNENGHNISLTSLIDIVDSCEKKRFVLSQYNQKIRCNQGHSIDIDLDLISSIPPDILYHGTSTENKKLILKSGISKQSRQFVHLSSNIETAKSVGKRHGEPYIFKIDAKKMGKDGVDFFKAENGIWLTEYIDTKYFLY